MPSPRPGPDGTPSTGGRTRLLVFDRPERLLEAVRRLRAGGFAVLEAYSPFPVHGIDDAMALPETRLAWATLCGAVLGGGFALSFQAWTHAVSWPLDIGGKPNPGLPALVPIGFELTVLFAAFFTAGTLAALAAVLSRRDGAARSARAAHVTDDRFAVLVGDPDDASRTERLDTLCDELSPLDRVEARAR